MQGWLKEKVEYWLSLIVSKFSKFSMLGLGLSNKLITYIFSFGFLFFVFIVARSHVSRVNCFLQANQLTMTKSITIGIHKFYCPNGLHKMWSTKCLDWPMNPFSTLLALWHEIGTHVFKNQHHYNWNVDKGPRKFII